MSAPFGIYMAEGKIDPSSTLKELGIDDLTPLTEVEKTATVKDLLSARSGMYIEELCTLGQMTAATVTNCGKATARRAALS